MKIAIVGTGYVGLATGVCLSELGHSVVCIDNVLEKVEMLRKGKPPIYEPGIEDLLKRNIEEGRLTFSMDISSAVKDSEVIFISVNTPPRNDGSADLRFVERVAKEIAFACKDCEGYKVIVDKSTVPVHTAKKLKETILRYGTALESFDVVSNPEFLREGTAVKDTLEPDRVVIGVDSDRAKEKMLEVYQPLVERSNVPIKIVSVRSAELIKHGANTFLTLKISFANLIAQACEAAGANALEVLEMIGMDSRIGNQFLSPGIGYGGNCFPKDVAAFRRTLDILRVDSSLISAIEKINEEAVQGFINKIERELWVLDGKTIGVLGLAFKANTDDMRNSPALRVIEKLMSEGAIIKAYDPQAMKGARKLFPDIDYCQDAYEVAQDSEALLICTEWEVFKDLDFTRIKEVMAIPIIFDGRNVVDPQKAEKAGIKYFGVGR